MTPLQIKQVAAEIAAHIPAMAQDCATNNAVVIEGVLMEALKLSDEEACKVSLPVRIP